MDRPGTYALVLALNQETPISVGKLGTFVFPIGYYLYVGSALAGLRSRIRRHLEGSPKVRWHIDYLRQRAKPVEVWCLESPERLECRWYATAAGMPGAQSPIKGFGSSDCRCFSHLVYFPERPGFKAFLETLGEAKRGIWRIKPPVLGLPLTLARDNAPHYW